MCSRWDVRRDDGLSDGSERSPRQAQPSFLPIAVGTGASLAGIATPVLDPAVTARPLPPTALAVVLKIFEDKAGVIALFASVSSRQQYQRELGTEPNWRQRTAISVMTDLRHSMRYFQRLRCQVIRRSW